MKVWRLREKERRVVVEIEEHEWKLEAEGASGG